jgi:hypothetical protein
VRAWLHRHRAPLLLAFFSPAIAEILSGSTIITTVFVDPLFFVIAFSGLLLFYGGGVLLIREAAVRWNKSWGSILLLGAAYGIAEEALAVHTFFLPGGSPVGALGGFGRVGGVNTVWAVGLTGFHTVYSIALPILLIELMFPETRGVRFLEGRMPWVVGGGYVGIVSLFAATTPGFPGALLYLLFLGLAIGLVVLARYVPSDLLTARPGPMGAPSWAFVLAGLAFMTAWLVVGLGGPWFVGSAALALLLLVAVDAAVLGFVLRYAGSGDNHWAKYWFAVGMLSFYLPWDILLEFILDVGSLVLVPLLFLFLYWLHRRLRHARSMDPSARVGPASATP